ncbi:hypothetical protein AQ436_00045 [Arthrobacter sp. EpRS66]|nr:hypothetical protein AQ436_00045 [Arthrobacter sp. EpRS66]
MTKYTPARSLPYPEINDHIADEVAPEDSIREDFSLLASATDRELQIEAAKSVALETSIATLPERADLVSGNDPRAVRQVERDDYMDIQIAKDPEGNTALGITNQGVPWMGHPPIMGGAIRTKIACFGDSLVRGYTGSVAWDLTEAWPYLLQQELGGSVEVTNLGFGGNPTSEIRMRVSAMPVTFSVTGGSIPVSGSVAVTTNRKIGLITTRSTSINGYLAGVYGTLLFDGTSYTFTRAFAGTNPVTVSGPVPLIVDRGTDYSNHTGIVWYARNDESFGTTGAYDTVADHVIAADVEMAEWFRANRKSFLLISTTNRVDEPMGSPHYESIKEINDRRKALFPSHYIDIRSWLVHEAIYEAGITPTQADLDNMAVDAPPPSIMDGGSHYNKPIAPLIAKKLAKILKERGMVL